MDGLGLAAAFRRPVAAGAPLDDAFDRPERAVGHADYGRRAVVERRDGHDREFRSCPAAGVAAGRRDDSGAVSYTHLTLPTKA